MSDQSLAKVDDVIAHGEAIPANVKVFTDRDGDRWVRTARTRYTQIDDPGDDAGFVGGGFKQQRMQRSRHWWPLTVAEVDPQPAEDYVAPSLAREVGKVRITPVEISTTCNGCGNFVPPPALHKATCPTRTAPPREPRTWPKLDPSVAPDELLPEVVQVKGIDSVWRLDPGLGQYGAPGEYRRTLEMLRMLGEVREVLT